jgi:hypothetical protein
MDGYNVGASDGNKVGESVGATEGYVVGDSVGAIEGYCVGNGVGRGLGAFVGAVVGGQTYNSQVTLEMAAEFTDAHISPLPSLASFPASNFTASGPTYVEITS